MTEEKKIYDHELGTLTFKRIEESKNPNLITYILETSDGRFSKTQRLRRYNLGGRKIILGSDMQGKQQEIRECNDAIRQMIQVLKVTPLEMVAPKGYKAVLSKIG